MAELNSRRILNERYIHYLDVMEAYWESQTPKCYRLPRLATPEPAVKSTKPKTKPPVDIPVSAMGPLGDLFLGLTAPLDPDDLPDDADDDLVPV